MQPVLVQFDKHLEDEGWGKPPRYFAGKAVGDLVGDEGLIGFFPFLEIDGHPSEVLKALVAEGVTIDPPDSAGIALVVEGWRHLTADELHRDQPEKYEQLFTIAAEESSTGDLEEIQTLVQKGWSATVADLAAPTMPEELRKQIRNIILVLRTGIMLTLVRDRGGEPVLGEPISAERLPMSRVPHNMWQYLVGEPLTD